eukprot:14269849-Alexandrium_andersonii.AAC.1
MGLPAALLKLFIISPSLGESVARTSSPSTSWKRDRVWNIHGNVSLGHNAGLPPPYSDVEINMSASHARRAS